MYNMIKEKLREKLEAMKASLPPTCNALPCAGCPHPTECSAKSSCLDNLAREHLSADRFPEYLTTVQARALQAGLDAGHSRKKLCGGTTRDAATFVVNVDKVKKHQRDYPVWGAGVQSHFDDNFKKADMLKGQSRRRKNGLCQKGHDLDEWGSVYFHANNGHQYLLCRKCQQEQRKIGVLPTMQKVGLAVAAMMQRTPIKDITGGGNKHFIMTHANFARCRREYPFFDKIAQETIDWCRANPRPSAALLLHREGKAREQAHKFAEREAQRAARFALKQAQRSEKAREKAAKAEERARAKRLAAMRERSNITYSRHLTDSVSGPSNPIFDACLAAVPGRMDRERRLEVIASLALAVCEGQITLEQVKDKVPEFLRDYTRTYQSKYGPISLDEPAFFGNGEYSSVPRVETIDADTPLWEERA